MMMNARKTPQAQSGVSDSHPRAVRGLPFRTVAAWKCSASAPAQKEPEGAKRLQTPALARRTLLTGLLLAISPKRASAEETEAPTAAQTAASEPQPSKFSSPLSRIQSVAERIEQDFVERYGRSLALGQRSHTVPAHFLLRPGTRTVRYLRKGVLWRISTA
jgi:hypothetical protein